MYTEFLVKAALRAGANLLGHLLAAWGSRGREFKSPQPDGEGAGQGRCEGTGSRHFQV